MIADANKVVLAFAISAVPCLLLNLYFRTWARDDQLGMFVILTLGGLVAIGLMERYAQGVVQGFGVLNVWLLFAAMIFMIFGERTFLCLYTLADGLGGLLYDAGYRLGHALYMLGK